MADRARLVRTWPSGRDRARARGGGPTVEGKARARWQARIAAGDLRGLLALAPPGETLALVAACAGALRARGLYERALLAALTRTPTNNAGWSSRDLRALVARADRARLRAAGDPLPGPGPFEIFRGVAGRVPHRSVRGLSWSLSPRVAAWFALRYALLHDPAVYRLNVAATDVLAYLGASFRGEDEVLVLCDGRAPVRCRLAGAELAGLAAAHEAARCAERHAATEAALDRLDAAATALAGRPAHWTG